MLTGPQHAVRTARANATGSAATISISDGPRRYAHLSRVTFSYGATPTGGRLTVSDATGVRCSIPITAGGPGPLGFNMRCILPMTITLASGGGGIEGEVYAEYIFET